MEETIGESYDLHCITKGVGLSGASSLREGAAELVTIPSVQVPS